MKSGIWTREARAHWSGFLDLLYPPRCLVCRAFQAEPLCPACREAFAPVPHPQCARCGRPLKSAVCNDCANGLPTYLSQARAACLFQGPLRQAILNLKYYGKAALAELLAEYLVQFVSAGPFSAVQFDVVIPVPLHSSRERERGYNQSALLAAPVARELGILLAADFVTRTRRTRAQVDLSAPDRRANVRGAFEVTDSEPVKGMTVLLVDDVYTTCSTLDECARVLLESGAKSVYALCLARDV